jgi:hypothetical protein
MRPGWPADITLGTRDARRVGREYPGRARRVRPQAYRLRRESQPPAATVTENWDSGNQVNFNLAPGDTTMRKETVRVSRYRA